MLRSFVGFVVLLVLLASPATAQEFPPLTGRVVDTAGTLTQEQQVELSDRLAEIEQRSGDGTQIVVAVVPTLGGLDQKTYSTRLFKAWGLGRRDRNNGVLLLVAMKERKVSIRVGTGLEETLTNARCDAIVRDAIVPAFRRNDFFVGIRDGVQMIGERVGPGTIGPEETPTAPPPSAPSNGSTAAGLGVVGLVLAVVVGGPIVFAIWLARRVLRSRGDGSYIPVQAGQPGVTIVPGVIDPGYPAGYYVASDPGYATTTAPPTTTDWSVTDSNVVNTDSGWSDSSNDGFSAGGGDTGGGGSDGSW